MTSAAMLDAMAKAAPELFDRRREGRLAHDRQGTPAPQAPNRGLRQAINALAAALAKAIRP